MVTEAVAKAGGRGCSGADGMGGSQLSVRSPLTNGHAWGAEKTWVAIQGL